jgi:hypothetical protein
MNASLAQHVVPVTSNLAVVETHGVLKLTLFPRRLVPPVIWIAIASCLLFPLVFAFVRPLRAFDHWALFLGLSSWSLYQALTPYRLRFQLSGDGLLYDGDPSAKRHRFELALDEIEAIRAAREGDEVLLLVTEAKGHAHVIRCLGMSRPDADAVAFTLQRRLEELRETRETFRA